jgi:hypothetical protein
MNKFIELATDRLRSKLSDKKAFYELSDLRASELPDIVVQPLQRELVKRLRSELEMPLTEWADLNDEAVHRAWGEFVETAEDHVRLPDYKVEALLKAIVNKLYPLITWPRTQISKFIFGNHEELDRSEIAERVEQLPINQQLGSAVMRYMNKKNVDRLSRKKCEEIVKKIDEKLTERYSTDQWFQSILPLFELACGPVPTDQLATYFFHRGHQGWSNKLAQIDGEISKSEFEEWLEERSTDTAATKASKDDAKQFPDNRSSGGSNREENINAGFTSRESNAKPSGSPKGEQPKKQQPTQTPDSKKSGPAASSVIASESSGENTTQQEADEPIWRRFVSNTDRDDQQTSEGEQQQDSESAPEHNGDDGYQLNELFKEDNGNLDHESAQHLNQYLEGKRQYFIREVFRGSLSAYEQAIKTLAACEDWQEAYPYIDRQIFDRNDIDLYSRPALEFTDTMQSYFQRN